MIGIVLGVLATWRLTSLLHYEDGPWRVFERLRRKVRAFEEDKSGSPMSFLGGLVSCFACLSLWLAVIPAMISTWLDIIQLDIIANTSFNGIAPLLWFCLRVLAYSTGAIIIDRMIE